MASATNESDPAGSNETELQGQKSAEDNSAEIAEIKSLFTGRCRIIDDSGAYKYIVTIQPEDLDVTIKFQLRATYPSVVPDITIRSSSLSNDQILQLCNSLTEKAKQLTKSPMINQLMEHARQLLSSFGLKRGKVSKINSHTVITDKAHDKKKKGKRRKTPKSEDEVEEEKKKPMKTAGDVIKRILWDEALDKDEFLVGYIDRFRGLLEKYFSAFSWEDIASVDYDVLAIPHHRIQYFKYKSVKVWDKTRRIDNVFGSAKGTTTIDVVMKELDELEGKNIDYEEGSAKQNQRDSSSEDSYSDSESDDEDEIVVTIGASANIGIKPKDAAETIAEVEKKDEDSYNPYWRDKLRPNYFICVRITDPNIIDHTAVVQDHLLEQEPVLGECCIPGSSLHVTLCTVGLDTADQLVNCMNSLKKMKYELQSFLPKSVLKLHGVSNFYQRVIYAKVDYQDDFLEFCNVLKLNLREAGIDIRDGYEFVPHMTILKTTRPVSKARGTKIIRPKMYERYLEKHFGEQRIDKIQLCSMSSERREDGFYITPTEIAFD